MADVWVVGDGGCVGGIAGAVVGLDPFAYTGTTLAGVGAKGILPEYSHMPGMHNHSRVAEEGQVACSDSNTRLVAATWVAYPWLRRLL